MSASKSWLRRLDKLEAGLPPQPAESPYHLRAFEALGELQGLAARQPDFTGLLRAYRGLRPPYGTEKAGRLHDHLLGLSGRAEAGGPPRSAAAFAGLAGRIRPVPSHGQRVEARSRPRGRDDGDAVGPDVAGGPFPTGREPL